MSEGVPIGMDEEEYISFGEDGQILGGTVVADLDDGDEGTSCILSFLVNLQEAMPPNFLDNSGFSVACFQLHCRTGRRWRRFFRTCNGGRG